MKKQLYVGISLVSASLLMSLAACGDDSSSGTDSKAVTPDFEVQTFDDLGICAKTAEGTVGFVKDDQASYTCKSGEWVKNDENSSSKDNDSKDSDDDGGKTSSGDDSGKTSSDDDSGKTSADDDNGDKTPSGDNGDGTPFSFGPAGASLSSEMFESLSGTAWADKEGDIHDKWTFSSLSDGKITITATMINDDGTPYDDTSLDYSLDVARGVLIDAFGDDEEYIIYADGLLLKVYLSDKFKREGFSEGLVGKWVNDEDDFINISADGKRSINNGVTSASIEKMSNGVMYYKLGSVPQYLYYDGTNIYEVTEVLYPVE
ncbi:MAG: hypothetical protein IKC23_08260 [Fibrobacter sp.]|nr:hypothetical protein [Fibrobacter sp.]